MARNPRRRLQGEARDRAKSKAAQARRGPTPAFAAPGQQSLIPDSAAEVRRIDGWWVCGQVLWKRPVVERDLVVRPAGGGGWFWGISPRPDLSPSHSTWIRSGKEPTQAAAKARCDAAWSEMAG